MSKFGVAWCKCGKLKGIFEACPDCEKHKFNDLEIFTGGRQRKGRKMEKKVLCLAIKDEFEGDSPMYFDLQDPIMLVNYLKDNIERNEDRTFKLTELTETEFKALE